MRKQANRFKENFTGHPCFVSTIAHLGNIAYRTKRKIVWDGDNEKIIGDRDADRLVGVK